MHVVDLLSVSDFDAPKHSRSVTLACEGGTMSSIIAKHVLASAGSACSSRLLSAVRCAASSADGAGAVDSLRDRLSSGAYFEADLVLVRSTIL